MLKIITVLGLLVTIGSEGFCAGDRSWDPMATLGPDVLAKGARHEGRLASSTVLGRLNEGFRAAAARKEEENVREAAERGVGGGAIAETTMLEGLVAPCDTKPALQETFRQWNQELVPSVLESLGGELAMLHKDFTLYIKSSMGLESKRFPTMRIFLNFILDQREKKGLRCFREDEYRQMCETFILPRIAQNWFERLKQAKVERVDEGSLRKHTAFPDFWAKAYRELNETETLEKVVITTDWTLRFMKDSDIIG